MAHMYNKLEELEQDAETVHEGLRGLRSKMEDLPTEPDEIEDDEEDTK